MIAAAISAVSLYIILLIYNEAIAGWQLFITYRANYRYRELPRIRTGKVDVFYDIFVDYSSRKPLVMIEVIF